MNSLMLSLSPTRARALVHTNTSSERKLFGIKHEEEEQTDIESKALIAMKPVRPSNFALFLALVSGARALDACSDTLSVLFYTRAMQQYMLSHCQEGTRRDFFLSVLICCLLFTAHTWSDDFGRARNTHIFWVGAEEGGGRVEPTLGIFAAVGGKKKFSDGKRQSVRCPL